MDVTGEILRAVAEHEMAEAPGHLAAEALVGRLGLPLGLVEEALRACEVAGLLWLVAGDAGAPVAVEKLTLAGRRRLRPPEPAP